MSFILPILERSLSLTTDQVNLIIGSEESAAYFVDKLKRLQEGLEDAEKKQVTDSGVKRWLQDLKDVMYEMDDTLDEWQIFSAGEKAQGSVSWDKVLCSLIQDLCLCFGRICRQREITLEMKNHLKKLDGLLDERGGKFNFIPTPSNETMHFTPPETTSKVDAKSVLGRDSDIDMLLSALLYREGASTSTNISVISVVGVGGLGKTTLAQSAYNDCRLVDHFQLKLWVSASNPFDAKKVARGILESGGQKPGDTSTLEALTTDVENLVSNKTFLLILDNVWMENDAEWETLKNCLHGAPGSRILVTARNSQVAETMGSIQPIILRPLSDIICGQILNERALRGKNAAVMETLRPIGEEVAKKCGGSPLAARVLGGMLAYRKTEEAWRYVLESPMLEQENGVEELLGILNLSYIDLSPTLKLCFSSCAMFKKGDKVKRDELIRIWESKGYLTMDAGAEQIQSKGENIFNSLAMRSFFQDVWVDEGLNETFCKIHDVMHDFAIRLSKNEHCFIVDGSTGEEKMISHLSSMRTFVGRNVSEKELILVNYLKRVRLLIISQCNLEEIPQEIGKLVHLRYLDLSLNPMKELPETLCDLYHLQTLCLEYCSKLSMLPEEIDKLVNLRHILNKGTMLKLPVENLRRLWTLGKFMAGREYNKLGHLKKLNLFQRTLEIVLLNMKEADVEEAEKADLVNKHTIQCLSLVLYGEVSRDVMKALQPPPNLKRLDINGDIETWLGCWISNSYLQNLKFLSIFSLRCTSLAGVGKLPSLETLSINSFYLSVGVEFLGINSGGSSSGDSVVEVSAGFPNLKELTFSRCFIWEEWEDIGEVELESLPPLFPRLQLLTILGCSSLKGLPHNLLGKVSSLQALTITGSPKLYKAYCEGGVHRDKISHIPNILLS